MIYFPEALERERRAEITRYRNVPYCTVLYRIPAGQSRCRQSRNRTRPLPLILHLLLPWDGGYPLNSNPLDLIEGDLVAGAVVELGGTWAFVRRHELRIF